MAAIRTEGITKVYGSVHALDGLTLTVEPGIVFGFLGPNGAGKTTMIRLLTGMAKPTRGRAWVAGEEIADSGKVAARIGYLPEEPAFYRWMTPTDLLDHVGRLFGLSSQERGSRTKELLELTGLSQVGKRRIGGFSRGMRQRLGLAQALVNRPEVLFLDEPVSALDPGGRREILEMIAHLRGQCTVFMSTHILQDVERVCDAVGIINQGKLVVEAPQAELLDRYTVPAFELECKEGSELAFEALLEALRGLDWVTSAAVVPTGGAVARIVVKDLGIAHRELLQQVVHQAAALGVILHRYQIVTPSLEDIFLRLVGEAAEGRQRHAAQGGREGTE
ncbi:MAG: ABC transporter ATP-binding protein [Anaerolineae bacterium]|nr:ABC transporter ATP-binding protein [Anaerolineae bacterium]